VLFRHKLKTWIDHPLLRVVISSVALNQVFY